MDDLELETKRTEKEYRALQVDSYSTLSTFAKDRRQYYKKYYIGEPIDDEDEDGKAILMGTLVETLILEGQEEFDNKFYMSITQKDPTPGVLRFINALYRRTLACTDELGVVQGDFIELCTGAYEDAQIKKPGFKKFIEDFVGSEDETYYKQIRETRPLCKSIVSMQDIDNANRIVQELRESSNTAFIFNQETDSRYQVYNQLQADGYSIDGLPFKSMYDKIIVDHFNKTIQFYDLKCTWQVEGFYEEYYLRRRAYIQAYVYHYALVMRHVDLGFDYGTYEIKLPIFVVVDSINYMRPLLFQASSEDLLEAYDGFTWKNRYHMGVGEIIRDLKWAKDNNEWRISRQNYQNKGIVNLKKAR